MPEPILATPVWNADCLLGEGCLWDAAHQRLLFVDIKQPAVHAYTPASGLRQRWPVPEMIGWLVPREKGGFVAGLQSGVALLDLPEADGAAARPRRFLYRLHPPGSPLRLNDAKADAEGRLWFGSMNNEDESRPEGLFYRLDPDGSLHEADRGYRVTNGPTLSLDGRTLYHTDSHARCIHAYPVGPGGQLGERREWKRITGPVETEGYPDGMCTDAEDHLWVARWGAGCVTRLDPAGREVARIHTGAPHTTNCAFGGPDMNDLYITSARIGLDTAALAAAPTSGALFVARGVGQGRAAHAYTG